MADDEWKKRVGVVINYSSDEDDKERNVEICGQSTVCDRVPSFTSDNNEVSVEGLLIDDDGLIEYDDYGTTPPRTRISRRLKERKQKEREIYGVSEAKSTTRIIHPKTKRRNTLDSIHILGLLEKSDNEQLFHQDYENVELRRGNKRFMKLQRDTERDMKLEHAYVRHSMPPAVHEDTHIPAGLPHPPIKIETSNRFHSLTSKLVACRQFLKQGDVGIANCPENRVDFYNTFSLLIRMGSAEKQADKNPRRQLSKEEHLWQNELKDLIWLELQAWHADRTPTQQDEYLCKARENIEVLLDEIMNYRFSRKLTRHENSKLPLMQRSTNTPKHPFCCVGSAEEHQQADACLHIYCATCIENQAAALTDVKQLLDRLEVAEGLYQSSKAFGTQHPVYKSDQFEGKVKALCLWYNMTKRHWLKLLIIGKHLMQLDIDKPCWPPPPDFQLRNKLICSTDITKWEWSKLLNVGKLILNDGKVVPWLSGSDDDTSGIGTDTGSSDDGLAISHAKLTRSNTRESENNKGNSLIQNVQFEIETSSPSDSNNSSSSSSQGIGKSDGSIDFSEQPPEPHSRTMNFASSTEISSSCNVYRTYIGKVLKTSGLRKAIHFLEKLHKDFLLKSMITLKEPVKVSGEKEKDDPKEFPDLCEKLINADSMKDVFMEDLERYGYWSTETQEFGLPSYLPYFLFLTRIPLDMIHEFLKMRLEEKPECPSALCIRQLMRELKEGLKVAVLQRQRYLYLIKIVLWKSSKTTLQNFQDGIKDFDGTVRCIFELYLEYLQQWAEMVQQERFQKNLLEEEWMFVKATSPVILGGEALGFSSFCEIASGMLEAIGDYLLTEAKQLAGTIIFEEIPDEDSSAKQTVLPVLRKFQNLFNEVRERALKAVAFAKTLRKDLETGCFVKEDNQCNIIIGSIESLKSVALQLCRKISDTICVIENSCNVDEIEDLEEHDKSAVLRRIRDILELGFKFGFEYHKEVCRLVTGDSRTILCQTLIDFAILWMKFVKERFDRGRGRRPRWANQGLDFLMTVCEPQNTQFLSDEKFEDLKKSIDECISHVIGTAVPTNDKTCGHSPIVFSPRPSLNGQHSRSRGSSPASRNRSPSYRSSRSYQDPSNQTAIVPTQRSLSVQVHSSVDECDSEVVTAEVISVPMLAVSPIERVRTAIKDLENQIETKLRNEELIGCVTDVESEDRIHIKSRSVTFSWQRGIKIGQGRFGKVYTAVNNQTGELMAMKEIQLQPNDHRTIRRIADELRTFEGIHDQTLVRYYGVEIHREEMLIFMEYCAEGTLESLVASTENGLPETLIRRYTSQLLQAVAILHRHGIVHRDIKSANIFLTDEGNSLKLGDFGSAVKIKAHQTMPGELKGYVGTQAYMAPEVFMKSEGHGRAADIWSVGCVVVEMASGKRPWAEFDSNYQIMFKVGMGETPKVPETLSDEGRQFLELCLQHDPRQRSTAEDLQHHTFVKVDDDEYLSSILPSITEEFLKLGIRR